MGIAGKDYSLDVIHSARQSAAMISGARRTSLSDRHGWPIFAHD
jgi:hypothetical protein